MKISRKLLLLAVAVLLLAALAVVGVSAEVTSGTCGATGDGSSVTWAFDSSTGTLTISAVKGSDGKMMSGSSNADYPWDKYRSSVKTLVVEEGVKSVGNRAFNKMADMTSASLPSTLETIGTYVFSGCTSLPEITIPGKVSSLNDTVFGYCYALTDVVIEYGVVKITPNAFLNCTALKSLVIPSSVTVFGASTATGSSAVKGCTALESITFCGTDTSIGGVLPSQNIKLYGLEGSKAKEFAEASADDNVTFEYYTTGGSCGDAMTWSFDGKTGIMTVSGEGKMTDYARAVDAPWSAFRPEIKSIIIGEKVTSVGARAFYGATKTSSISLPSTLTGLGSYAFAGCDYVTHIDLPASVTSLGDSIFSGCDALVSIDLKEGLTDIQARTFDNCISLKSLVVPSTVTKFGSNVQSGDAAIKRCTAIESITFLNPDIVIWGNLPAQNIVFYGMNNSTAQEYAAKSDSDNITFAYVSDSGKCGENASWSFSGETRTLTVGGEGEMAQYYSTKLNEIPWWKYRNAIDTIKIEEGITHLSRYAFDETTVKKAIIADSVISIKGYTFRKCYSLEEVEGAKNVTFLGEYSFHTCKALKSIELSSIKTIGQYAFTSCESLYSVNLGDSLETVENHVFNSCTSLKEITFPASLKTLGKAGMSSSPFTKYSGIEKITFLGMNTTFVVDLPAELSITFCGYEGSDAQKYADSHDKITFVVIAEGGDDTPTEPEIITSGTCGANATWAFDTETGTLTISGHGNMADYTKAGIADIPWYHLREMIETIVVEDGIVSIGAFAFNETSVKKAIIADSVLVIDGYSFRMNYSLEEVVFSKNLMYIGEYAFNTCSALKGVELPGIKTIGNYAFTSCTSLAYATLGEGVEVIMNGAFNNCSALKEITLPSTLKTLGYETSDVASFASCSGLERITFLSDSVVIYPDSATAIPSNAVIYCYESSDIKDYAEKYDREYGIIDAPFAQDVTTVFDIDAVAIAGNYASVAAINRLNVKGETLTLDLVLANENGELCVLTADGEYEVLKNSAGKAITVVDGTKISIVYNDEEGTVRVYADGGITRYGAELAPLAGIKIAEGDFLDVRAVTDKLVLADGVLLDAQYEAADIPADFIGYQVNENNTDIRLVAGINKLYYDTLGFEVELYVNDELKGEITRNVSTVYGKILDGESPLEAKTLGYEYFAAAAVKGIERKSYPADANVYLKITPFSVVGGERLYDECKYITVEYGENGANNFVYGITAPFEPVVRFIASSDIHFTDSVGANAGRLTDILGQLSSLVLDESENDGYTGLDAVILAGDIANSGTYKQVQIAKEYLDANIPEDIELVITMGNHDWNDWGNIGPEQSRKQFEDAFGDATKDTVIGGYHFITICVDAVPAARRDRGYGWEYSEETIAEAEALIEAAIADTGKDKPIFIIQHAPVLGTVAGSDSMTPTDSLDPLFSKYPNLIVFAGHSHFPIIDECAIHQENYTSVGTGTLQVSQVHVVEADRYGRVRLRDYSGTHESFIGEAWFIDSFDKKDFTYTEDRFEGERIFFAEGAEITVAAGPGSATVSFLPVPEESFTAKDYKVVLKNASGEVIETQYTEDYKYYLLDYTTPVTFTFAGLDFDAEYSVEAYALNPLYLQDNTLEDIMSSEPLTKTFRTEKEIEEVGDLITLYINGTTASNVADSGIATEIKGKAPTYSYDSSIGMYVATFNGTDQALRHDYRNHLDTLKDGFTVEAYFRIDEFPETGNTVAFGAMQSASFGLEVHSNGSVKFCIHNTDSYKSQIIEELKEGTYYHFAAVYDGSYTYIYLDGDRIAEIEMNNLKLHRTESYHMLYVGADNNQGNVEKHSETTFAAFNLYSDALSRDEVIARYNELVPNN